MTEGTQVGLVVGIIIALVILTACSILALAMFLFGWMIL